MNKKIFTMATLALMFAFSLAINVNGALALTADDTGFGYTSRLNLGSTDIRDIVMNVINVLMGFLGIIAMIIILTGGFKWMTAGGSEDGIEEAKKLIMAGIVGLLIIFASYAIAIFVVSQLLKATGA